VHGDPRGPDRTAGQHFLRSRRISAELAEQVHIRPGDLVFEIGAGTGRLTEALADRGAEVLAVEVDVDLARRLATRLKSRSNVHVLAADVLTLHLPERPFRAFGNVPFSITTAILRRLLDSPSTPMERADLIVQFELARKRAAPWPSTLLSLSWAPWWTFSFVRRLSRAAFDPSPSVDAALLAIERRDPPLLDAGERGGYGRVLRTAFARSSTPVRRSLRLPSSSWKRLARDRGVAIDARPRDLDAFDWRAVYELMAMEPEERR
jgi:23S rRNA (adenine-N6)-dimethyltransferase